MGALETCVDGSSGEFSSLNPCVENCPLHPIGRGLLVFQPLFFCLWRKGRNSTKVFCASPSWSEYLYDIESGGIRTAKEREKYEKYRPRLHTMHGFVVRNRTICLLRRSKDDWLLLLRPMCSWQHEVHSSETAQTHAHTAVILAGGGGGYCVYNMAKQH